MVQIPFRCVLAVSVTSLLSGVSAQVNSEIDQFEDLLAVDSFANEVIVDRPRPRFNKKEVSRPFRKFSGGAGKAARVHKKINLDGSYNFRYSTGDGMSREERGQSDHNGELVQSGRWSYTGADGKQYEMKFVADQFGYRPQGAHLHVAHQLAFKQQEMLARRARARQARRLSRP